MSFVSQISGLQWVLIAAFLVFLALLSYSKTVALRYARVTVLIFVAILMLLPFVWLICAAFKDNSVLLQYPFLPPIREISSKTVNLSNYRELFTQRNSVEGPINFVQYIVNSLYLSSTTTFLTLLFSSMGGYALAKFRFKGRQAIFGFMLASMTIPSVMLLSPNYEVIWRLGWMDSFKALIIPASVSVFGIFLFRQAITGVPDELVEAGRIDGCSEFRIYLSLVMPLVRPMTGAFCLISFLGSWNAFLAPNLFLQSQHRLTLTVALAQYVGVYANEYGVFLAGTLLAIIPPAVLFLALQKEFIAGLTSGAVKQ